MKRFEHFLIVTLIALSLSTAVWAIPPEQLFKDKWSDKCASESGVETADYVGFSETEQCEYFVDTFRVQTDCTPATFKSLDANRLQMKLNNQETFIIEFLWSSQISIMEIIEEKPLKLKQVRILGRAEVREDLLTHYLYCP